MSHRRRARRTLLGLLGGAGALLVLIVGGGGWVYSGQLLPAPARDRTLDTTATLTDGGTVLLAPDRRACHQRFGLRLEGEAFVAYGGPLLDGSCDPPSGPVERLVQQVSGAPPTGTELGARFDEYVVQGTPEAVGLEFVEVGVPLDDGLPDAPAWHVEGSADWVIAVHGRSGTRAELLRILPTLAGDDRSVLVITHRNDMAGGPTTDGVGRFGQTEWRDLAAAVDHARREGARRIVLVGYSQGGSLVGHYLRERGEAGIAGVVLDSPLLSLSVTLQQQARLRGLADPLIPPILLGTRLVSQARAGLDIARVELVGSLADTTVPILLIHGAEDDFVPPGPSDELAARRPRDLVYERISGAGHTEGWNRDPARYEAAVDRFLDRVLS